MIELYTKLLDRGYARHPSSLFRYLQKQGFYKQAKYKEHFLIKVFAFEKSRVREFVKHG